MLIISEDHEANFVERIPRYAKRKTIQVTKELFKNLLDVLDMENTWNEKNG